jgi:hypothetical protein
MKICFVLIGKNLPQVLIHIVCEVTGPGFYSDEENMLL